MWKKLNPTWEQRRQHNGSNCGVENEVDSMHKAEASRGGEGRCLLLLRLKAMFWKLKVIPSQAFVTELHSCQLAFAHMQQPC